MEWIQRGEIETMTGLTDTDAYQLLSELSSPVSPGRGATVDQMPAGPAPPRQDAGAVHLAGDLASYITGQTIYVDGGETL